MKLNILCNKCYFTYKIPVSFVRSFITTFDVFLYFYMLFFQKNKKCLLNAASDPPKEMITTTTTLLMTKPMIYQMTRYKRKATVLTTLLIFRESSQWSGTQTLDNIIEGRAGHTCLIFLQFNLLDFTVCFFVIAQALQFFLTE